MGDDGLHLRATLFIYIEPTPYVLGFIRRIAELHKAPVEVAFIAENVSQPWNLALREAPASRLPKGTFAAGMALAKRLSSGRYGRLHLAGWGHPVLISALLLGWLHRIPVFMNSDTPLPVRSPIWKRVVKRLFYPVLFGIPEKVLAAGSRQAEYFRHYGVDDDRIVKLQLTVDVAEIMRRSEAIRMEGARPAIRREFGLAESQTVFIYVGRLEAHKGIGGLLEAFEALIQTRADADLLIVGDGRQRPRVEAAVRANHAVKYAGRLDMDGVIRAYNCADVALVPSAFEPWGLVVNEAMACGLPVIASDRVGCVDDLVKHGVTGLVFAAGSSERLRESMLYLLENPGRRIEMGQAGRRLISGWTLEDQARIVWEAWQLGAYS